MQNNSDNVDLPHESNAMIDEIIVSLTKSPKEISCKFFYDEYGSELFEQISKLDEYYLTRTEISILKSNIENIAETVGQNPLILELGSGSSRKIRILLDNLKSIAAYVPVDISRDFLLNSAKRLSNDYSDLNIVPLVADYTQRFEIPDIGKDYSKIVAYYPGSTIGNFNPDQAVNFLKNLYDLCGPGSGLLIGIDLKKDPSVLEKAYNDEKGITAQFNLNILRNMNSTFGTDFETAKWKHVAFYNEELGRIEMHLQSLEAQKVKFNGTSISFEKNERIHTENSYKYSVEEFSQLIHDFYTLKEVWSDQNQKFAVCYFEAD